MPVVASTYHMKAYGGYEYGVGPYRVIALEYKGCSEGVEDRHRANTETNGKTMCGSLLKLLAGEKSSHDSRNDVQKVFPSFFPPNYTTNTNTKIVAVEVLELDCDRNCSRTGIRRRLIIC